ncbi:MAG: pilus assembly protein [Solirubrobacterales bacterium]|nr:pilus assembly protein [Solirubrobacterales bacterium]
MTERAVIARLRGQRGQATVEFAGMVTWVLIAALFAWQLALVGWTAVSATNAARTAARLASRGASQTQAQDEGKRSLTFGLSNNSSVIVRNDHAVVHVPIPFLFPGFKPDVSVGITETAWMPYTG